MFLYRHPLRFCALLVVIFVSGCASYQPDYSAISATSNHQQAMPLPVDAEIADLIRHAQKYHPQVLAAKADLERAHANMTAAGAFMDPEVSLSQGINDSGYRTLALSQDIPIFQRRSMAIEQARAEHRAAEARLLQVQADLAANVVTAFSEFLYVQENLQLQNELISLLTHVVHVVEQQYAAGNGAMSDLLRAQNTRDAAQSDYENLKALKTSQQARLNSALGRDARAPLPSHFSLATTHQAYAHLPADADALYALANEQNATLLATQYELQALYVGRDVASRAGLPRLMLGVEYMDTDMGDGTFAGMVSFSLPIWRSNYRALQEAAGANIKSGEARLQAARLEVQAELSMALYQWREAERNRQLYGDVLVQRAEQAVASVLSQYSNSNATFADVVASQQEWLSFSLAYRRALANQLTAVATIQSLIVPAIDAEVSP
ncbi:TolC family protein [Aliidiomarina halalkaliphila]|uniref:TolC family protein n=1 Tax=Aliidiomarina halalkaliphila TaxID=2593535 RepID=A0A552X1L6_9GAMM|nr:TolC family protein [Aliidiomarina halalkaliphila]TRW48875.1 TolC family protein [Aliidiomarina halalkaliphila]